MQCPSKSNGKQGLIQRTRLLKIEQKMAEKYNQKKRVFIV